MVTAGHRAIIFGFLPQNLKMVAVAVAFSMAWLLAELSLEPECRRGHGAVDDAINAGQVQVARLRSW